MTTSTGLPYPSEIDQRKFLENLPNLPIFVRAEIPAEDQLPNVEDYHRYDALHWRGHLWVKRLADSQSWTDAGKVKVLTPQYPANPPEIDTDSLVLPEDSAVDKLVKSPAEDPTSPLNFTFKGTWPHDEELPNVEEADVWDGWFYKGRLWVKRPEGHWDELPELATHPIQAIPLSTFVKPEEPREDKGALARELMEQKAEVKRLRRIRIKHLCYLWLVWLISLAAISITAYGYIKRDLVITRYSDSRDCSLKVGNVTITGKRTYSYPAYSLWGQRWIQENNVQEVTTINLPGSRLDILMDAEPKWIGYRFTDGERGTQILKPALKYAFVMDKGMAMATYGGFCQPLDKQVVQEDPKSLERSIIN